MLLLQVEFNCSLSTSDIKCIMTELRINIKNVNNFKISSQPSLIHLALIAVILIMTYALYINIVFHWKAGLLLILFQG